MNRFQLNLFSGSLLFTALFIPILILSQKASTPFLYVGLAAFLVQTLIWYKSADFDFIDLRNYRQLVGIITLVVLPIAIYFNHHFIQLLWDLFIALNGTHPYTVIPIDPLIGKGQEQVLFQLLKEKELFTTTSPALLVGLRPLYRLYDAVGLFTPFVISKIVISVYFFVTAWINRTHIDVSFWLYNPIIWIAAIAQADFELFGLALFINGYLYFKKQEFQTAYLIWGLSITFGLPYLAILLFTVIRERQYKFIPYVFAVSAVWIFLAWDTQGFYNYVFVSQWTNSFLYTLVHFFTTLDVAIISGISISILLFLIVIFAFVKRSQSFQIAGFFISLLVLLPFSFNLLWALFSVVLFIQTKHIQNLKLLFTVLFLFLIFVQF